MHLSWHAAGHKNLFATPGQVGAIVAHVESASDQSRQ